MCEGDVQKPRHGIPLFTVIPRNRPILVAFYDTHGDTEDTFSTLPPGPHGGILKVSTFKDEYMYFSQNTQRDTHI